MSREIKFRAWNKVDKKFVRAPKIERQIIPAEPTRYGFKLKTRFILMQYTGLKDSRGREVYESDIVIGVDFSGVVKWINYSWQVHRLDANGEIEE